MSEKRFSKWYDGKNGLHVRFSLADSTHGQLMWDLSWRGFIVNKNVWRRTVVNTTTGEEFTVWDFRLHQGVSAEGYKQVRRTIERCFQRYLSDLIVQG